MSLIDQFITWCDHNDCHHAFILFGGDGLDEEYTLHDLAIDFKEELYLSDIEWDKIYKTLKYNLTDIISLKDTLDETNLTYFDTIVEELKNKDTKSYNYYMDLDPPYPIRGGQNCVNVCNICYHVCDTVHNVGDYDRMCQCNITRLELNLKILNIIIFYQLGG
jgi:hypothetical protein